MYRQRQKINTAERTLEVALKDENYEYMMHHVIDGRTLVPAMGYLIMVWETIGFLQGRIYDELSVMFENVKFERTTTVPASGSVLLTVMIHRGLYHFILVSVLKHCKLYCKFIKLFIYTSLDLFNIS